MPDIVKELMLFTEKTSTIKNSAGLTAIFCFFVLFIPPVFSSDHSNESVPKGLTEQQEDDLIALRRKLESIGVEDNWAQVLQLSQKSIERYPNDLYLLETRLAVFEALNMPDKAIFECNKFLKCPLSTGPEKEAVKISKARMQALRCDFDAALRTLESVDLSAADSRLSSQIHDLKSEILQKQGKITEARQELEESTYDLSITHGPLCWVGTRCTRAKELGILIDAPILPRESESARVINELIATAIADPIPRNLSEFPLACHLKTKSKSRMVDQIEYVGASDGCRKSIKYRVLDEPKYGTFLDIRFDPRCTIITAEMIEKALVSLPETIRPKSEDTHREEIKRYVGESYILDLCFYPVAFKSLTNATIMYRSPEAKKYSEEMQQERQAH